MIAGTGFLDAGLATDILAQEGQGISPLYALQENYDQIPNETIKIMARRIGIDHGDIFNASDGYMTAWFLWLLNDDPEAAMVFAGNGAELRNNPLYYYASTRYVADAARILDLPEAEEYEARAEVIKKAILDEYFSSTGRLSVDTQTGYLVALKFGVYKDKERILEGLQKRFKQDLNRLKGGFVGATMMNCVLAEHGMVEKAYDLLSYEGFPGWLYAVNLGATTIWERWNSVLPDGSISGTGMNSLNHYAYPGACASGSIKAGNDIMMPGTPGHHEDLMSALQNPDAAYPITRADLEKCAARMIQLSWHLTSDKT